MNKSTIHNTFALFILALTIWLGLGNPYVLAQETEIDTVLTVRASIVRQSSMQDLTFDVWVVNESERWHRWANGTFQVRFPGVAMENCSIELETGSSELSATEYEIIYRAFPGRISIGVLGPDEFNACAAIGQFDSLRIGRFTARIAAPDILPFNLEWVGPFRKYQACAHKISADSLPWYSTDENVDMNSRGLATRYLVDVPDAPAFELAYFEGEYYGDKVIRLRWGTRREYLNRGFVLVRGIRPFGDLDNSNVKFLDTVACYTDYPAGTPECKSENLNSPGLSFTPLDYVFNDSVDFRDEQYVYELLYHRSDMQLIQLDTAVITVPASVISFAQASPNPFRGHTIINYQVDDRVILTAKVFDVNGREVATLIDAVDTPKGRYEIEWFAPAIAQQGVYLVHFLALPVNDDGVKESTADLKLQLVR